MYPLFLEAYAMLVRFEFDLARRNFHGLYRRVRDFPIAIRVPPADAATRICSAVDLACVWYWKQVRCLERSAATTCLLRRYGIRAQLIIGAQNMPFKAHAWVEVDGQVVNDKPYTRDIYAVLDRC
jgi:Transglutaminase-like superfamily